jgi:hypothetical protein
MSLRRCKNHNKPFPCKQCRIENALKPAQKPVVTPVVLTAEDILAERKKKDAERKRNERKVRNEQLAAIKQALKTPVADILATRKHEQIVANATKPHSVQTTSFNSTKLEQIAAAVGRSDVLRGDKTDPTAWPVSDRRQVKPEGTSQDQEDNRSFVVRESTRLEYGQALIDLSHSIFVPSADPDLFVCRLCRETVSNREKHIETVHGESADKRFGNMIVWQIRQYAKRQKVIAQAVGKKAA